MQPDAIYLWLDSIANPLTIPILKEFILTLLVIACISCLKPL